MERLLQDIRFSVRSLRKRPGFTAVAVLTLALAIGATTAIFSVVNAALLRPLPFADPDRLMQIWLSTPASGGNPGQDRIVWSYPKYETFRDAQRIVGATAVHSGTAASLTGREDPERVPGELVGAAYFRVLGIQPALGRAFVPEEDSLPGTRFVVVLGHSLWQRQFAADPRVVGTTAMLDARAYTIVGVAPPGFRGMTGTAEYWVPIMSRSAEELAEPWSHFTEVVGRLVPGVTPERAAAEMPVLGRRIAEAFPNTRGESTTWSARAEALDEGRVDPAMRRAVIVLFAAVGFVLLIACANIANLLLARATARRREVAVRLAVGASRPRLVRQLLTESVILAIAGAVAGIVIAWIGVKLLAAVNPGSRVGFGRPLSGLSMLVLSSIRIDGAALLFTMFVATVTALVFGLMPALHASRVEVTDALKGLDESAPGVGVKRARAFTGRGLLITTEIALALVLLIGAGLTMRSLAYLLGTKAGFDSRNLLTMRVGLPEGRYAADSSVAFFDQLVERLRGIPGVQSAAVANCPPLAGGCNGTIIWFRDRPPVPQGQEPQVGVHFITPGWARTMGVPLLRGRDFSASDRRGSPKVVLINETAARKFWPNEDPIGKPIGVGQGGFGDRAEIVGIIGDVRFGRVDEIPQPEVFISYTQAIRRSAVLFIRTSLPSASLVGAVRNELRTVDPSLPLYDIRAMDERVGDAVAKPRFSAVLLAVFAGLALVLAAVGIYGVMAFDVTQRTREIGIRMALGAGPRNVLGLILRQGMAVTALGIAAGLFVAWGTTRALTTLLYGIEPTDPATFVVLSLTIAAVAIVATIIPAIRATRVSPLVSIRR